MKSPGISIEEHDLSLKGKGEECQMELIGQCCCSCQFQLEDHSHPHTDGKSMTAIRGYICAPSPEEWAYGEVDRPIAMSGWPKHSCGCELYMKRKEVIQKPQELWFPLVGVQRGSLLKIKEVLYKQQERICPHNEEHDQYRQKLGYVRDGFDNHRSVCLTCFEKHSDRANYRFHSPHNSLAIIRFIEITDNCEKSWTDTSELSKKVDEE
jgi:hypothetical protein